MDGRNLSPRGFDKTAILLEDFSLQCLRSAKFPFGIFLWRETDSNGDVFFFTSFLTDR